MKKISLQWRITLMTAILLCVTCVVMNCLIIYSGKHYMDVIGRGISAYSSNDASRESSAGKLDEKGESLTARRNPLASQAGALRPS